MFTHLKRPLRWLAISLALMTCGGLVFSGGVLAGKPESGSYVLTDFGFDNYPNDVNNFGEVVGRDWLDGPRAVLWKVDGAGNLVDTIYLGSLSGFPDSEAMAINDLGEVVGVLETGGTEGRAFYLKPSDVDGDGAPDIWFVDDDQDGGNDLIVPLGTLPGGDYSRALAINNHGQIVGVSRKTEGGSFHPVVWQFDAGGSPYITELPNLGNYGEAHAINDFAEIVGHDQGTSVLWRLDGQGNVADTIDLKLNVFDGGGHAVGINNAGHIIADLCGPTHSGFGCAPRGAIIRPLDNDGDGRPDDINGDGEPDWVVDDDGDGINDFLTFLTSGGEMRTKPYDINEVDEVAGQAYKGDFAFHWQNGVLTDLNQALRTNLTWDLRCATAINDLGQIVGLGELGRRRDSELHGWLLTRQ